MEGLAYVAIITAAIACACFSDALAGAKGCERGAWAIAGFLFGPLALLAIAGMPDRRTQKMIRLIAESQGIDSQSLTDDIRITSSLESAFTSPIDANDDQLWALAIESAGPSVAKLAERKASMITPRIISIRTISGLTIYIYKSSRQVRDELHWTGRAVA